MNKLRKLKIKKPDLFLWYVVAPFYWLVYRQVYVFAVR